MKTEGMGIQEIRFRNLIDEEPENHDHKLVYSDWLEDHDLIDEANAWRWLSVNNKITRYRLRYKYPPEERAVPKDVSWGWFHIGIRRDKAANLQGTDQVEKEAQLPALLKPGHPRSDHSFHSSALKAYLAFVSRYEYICRVLTIDTNKRGINA